MKDQVITERYALYNADCVSVMQSLPDESVHLSIYSPPFCGGSGGAGLYVYSSNERDLSNCTDEKEFFEQYAFCVREIHRLTMPGRLTAVHCADVPKSNSGGDALMDFPGDIIRLHEQVGFEYVARHCIWKEPLAVRNRTMRKDLAHKTIVDDSSLATVAGADYLLLFRKRGDNPVPISHPVGLLEYAGERKPPTDVLQWRGWEGKQTENRFSHWIWRQYASSFWDDVRMDRVLPYQAARDKEDERHVHPLQLDVIDRILVLRSNPEETVLSPFAGVGSEIYSAVRMSRKGIGAELKPSYFRQCVRNVEMAQTEALEAKVSDQLFA